MTRKLAVILAADIAQYSRYVEENEEAALSHLRDLRQSMDPTIAAYGGRIANTAGDSVIAIFDSAVNAVTAAIAIQSAHKDYNSTLPDTARLQYRIGINIGDILLQPNGDVLGGGVNIAARLESIAQPGGICISENVFEQVDKKIQTELRKIGEHYVKNLSKPIKVYSVSETENSRLYSIRKKAYAILRKPLMPAIIGIFAALISISSVLFYINLSPDWAKRSFYEEGSFRGVPEADILANFDLVTEGRFDNSRYLVIRTWGGTISRLIDLAKSLGGHLASITSMEENSFVFELSLKDEGHWIVQKTDSGPQSSGPMIGLMQAQGSEEPNGGWQWQNGETPIFTAWAAGEPGNSGGGQDLTQFRANGMRPKPTWSDIGSIQDSVVIEIPIK